jgi:hypothetical protein
MELSSSIWDCLRGQFGRRGELVESQCTTCNTHQADEVIPTSPTDFATASFLESGASLEAATTRPRRER